MLTEFHVFFRVSVKSIFFSLIIKLNTILFSQSSFKILTFFTESQSISTKLEMYKFSWCWLLNKTKCTTANFSSILLSLKKFSNFNQYIVLHRYLCLKICYTNAKSCNVNPSYQKNLTWMNWMDINELYMYSKVFFPSTMLFL